ncbi:HD-GYP domain-containing protein [Kineococcus sp. SYSU DK002]|uniref:HD-GYP domain-containing protein n=1 Tax=Kineococcus sp. SYSU DK002 TaxID=3383123 RepID=UPI003D7CB4E3
MASGPTQNYAEGATTWRPRPVLAALVRAGASGGPVLFALGAGTAAAHWLPPSRVGLPPAVWLVLVVALSSVLLLVLSRRLRRLVPLAALLRLSLVLPDRVPSRFEVARRTWSPTVLEPGHGTGADTEGGTGGGTEGGTDGGSAQRLLALVGNLAAHDDRTRAHGERVQAYAALIGRELGLPDEDVDRLSWAALLHDVGKVHVPVDVINKNGRPSEEEWALLQQHPCHGGRLVGPLRPWLGSWLDGVEQHHERWDGGGYPRGLAGADVSLAARIIAVADTYDVITSARAYKKPMSAEQARAEITRCAGSQFDPDVVRAFLSVGIGRLRLVAGPATLLAALPGVGSVPAQALSTVSTAAQTAGGQVLAAVLSATVGVGAGLTAVAAPAPAAARVAAAAPATSSPAPVRTPVAPLPEATATATATATPTATVVVPVGPTVATPAAPVTAPVVAPVAAPTGSPRGDGARAPRTSSHTSSRTTAAATPTARSTPSPTPSRTATPTGTPTGTPTVAPTAAPTTAPTTAPTAAPTAAPSTTPTAVPSGPSSTTSPPTGAPTTTTTPTTPTTPTIPTATATATARPTASPTATPTATVRPTATPTATRTPTPTPTPTPTRVGNCSGNGQGSGNGHGNAPC